MLIGSRWFQFVPKMLFCSAAVRMFQPTMIDTQNGKAWQGSGAEFFVKINCKSLGKEAAKNS